MTSQELPNKSIDEILKEGAELSAEELLANFKSFTDQMRLSLFHRMINGTPTPYDELLKIWWMNRY